MTETTPEEDTGRAPILDSLNRVVDYFCKDCHWEAPTAPPNSPKFLASLAQYNSPCPVANDCCTSYLGQPEPPGVSRTKPSAMSCVSWFPNPRRLLAGTAGGELIVWDAAASWAVEDVKRVPASGGALSCLSWARDGALLFCGDSGGVVHLASATLAPLAALRDYGGHPVLALSPSHTALKLAGCAADASPKIWDTQRQSVERTLSDAGYDVTCLDWHPTASLLVTGTRTRQLTFWDPRVGSSITSIYAHKNQVTQTRWHRNGELLISVGRDGRLRGWDIRALSHTPVWLGELDPDSSTVEATAALAWHPTNDRLFVAGDTRGCLSFWDIGSTPTPKRSNAKSTTTTRGDLGKVEAAHGSSVLHVSWQPSGQALASLCSGREVRLWRPAALFPDTSND